jgi:hypothetical protein
VAFWRHCVTSPSDWGRTGRLWLSALMSQGMLVRRAGARKRQA